MSTISVECPLCETRFLLDRSTIGLTIRCPNQDCREVFVVQPVRPPVSADPPSEGKVAPVVPRSAAGSPRIVHWDENIAPPPTIVHWPSLQSLASPSRGFEPIVADSGVIARVGSSPPFRKTDHDSPSNSVHDKEVASSLGGFIPRRRTRYGRRLLLGLVFLGTVGVFAGGGGLLFRKVLLSDRQTLKEAEQLYNAGKFTEAAVVYDALALDYADRADSSRYLFFARLAELQAACSSPVIRDDPTPAHQRLTDFLSEYADHPLARPGSGYGADIVQAGQKLAGAIAEHGSDRIKALRDDRSQSTQLDTARRSLAEGRKVLDSIRPFRNREESVGADIELKLATLSGDIEREGARLKFLAPYRSLAVDPTATQIEQFQKAVRDAGFANDAEVIRLVADARKKLRDLIVFRPESQSAKSTRPDENGPVLLPAPKVATAPATASDVVYARVRGVLSAHHALTGDLLWSVRAGPVFSDIRCDDLPPRVVGLSGSGPPPFPDKPHAGNDYLIVVSSGNQNGLTAFRPLTGEVIWHQPLSDPPLGPAIATGNAILVPLGDPLGTILMFHPMTGELRGRLSLRQPIGVPPRWLEGESRGRGLLVVPAASRDVCVVEVKDSAILGKKEMPLALAVVVDTQHQEDTLLCAPTLLPGSTTAKQPARLLLSQSDGPGQMKLRLFDLPNADTIRNRAGVLDFSRPPLAETTLAGWSAFPPIIDGERIVVATDAGRLAVARLTPLLDNKPSRFSIFESALPTGTSTDSPIRSQVVSSSEAGVWTIRQGKLEKWKSVEDGVRELRYAPDKSADSPLGEPLSLPQFCHHHGLAFVLVRSTTLTANITEFAAFEVQTGKILWRRRLPSNDKQW